MKVSVDILKNRATSAIDDIGERIATLDNFIDTYDWQHDAKNLLADLTERVTAGDRDNAYEACNRLTKFLAPARYSDNPATKATRLRDELRNRRTRIREALNALSASTTNSVDYNPSAKSGTESAAFRSILDYKVGVDDLASLTASGDDDD